MILKRIQTSENFVNYLVDKINYQVFLCYKIIKQTTAQKFFKNPGSILVFSFTIFNLIGFSIFTFYFIKNIQNQILKLMPKDIIDETPKIKTNNSPPKKVIKKKIIIRKPKNINIQKSNDAINLEEDNSERKNIENKSDINIIKVNNKNKEDNISENSEIIFTYSYENYNNDNEIDSDNYNDLPFTQALRLDKRNIFIIYLSILKMKIEIISIIFYPEEYTHRSLTLSIFLFNCLFSYFMNALLYSDEVVSQKYHNNGQLDLLTSIFLSFASNIISSIFVWLIKILCVYNIYLILMVKEIKDKDDYQLLLERFIKWAKIKTFFYYIFNLIISIAIIYYLYIFCELYKKSQLSLFINYIVGISESLIFSFGISIVIFVLRIIGLKFKIKKIYRISVYLNNKF